MRGHQREAVRFLGSVFFINNFSTSKARGIILTPSCSSCQAGWMRMFLSLKGQFWNLTSGHARSRSRCDLSRSCCISFDAPWREEHCGTNPTSLANFYQKLWAKNVRRPDDVIMWPQQGCGAGAGAGAGAARADTFWSEPEPESPERFARSWSRSRNRQKWGGSGSEKGYNCGKKKTAAK